jgi:signal transduction histidine kinase
LERLFRPFDSTKGVSGMGMGVYQSREFLRSIDGELSVRSEVNVGTQFTIEIPVQDTATLST